MWVNEDYKIEYYNSNNRLMLILNEYPYYTLPSEWKNWSWAYDNTYGKLTNFRRNKESYPLSIIIRSNSKEDRESMGWSLSI